MALYQDIFSYMNQTGYIGMSGTFGYVAYTVPVFFPFVLLCIGVIILLGSYYSEKRNTGQGDFMGSFATASIVTAVLSTILFMINPPLIDPVTEILCVILAVAGVASMFTSPER